MSLDGHGRAPRRGAVAVIALLLLAAYAVPLFFPPAAAPFATPGTGAGVLERIFPGVPGWWVGGRIACVLLASVLVAWLVADAALPLAPSADAASVVVVPPRWALGGAVLIAGLCALTSLWAGHLSRPAQYGYVLALPLPALLLWTASTGRARRRIAWPPVALVAALIATWCVWRIPAALHAPQAADSVDTWMNFRWFVDAANDGRNLLTHSSQPGLPDTHMFFEGIAFFGPGTAVPTLTWVQGVHAAWIAVTAAAIGALTGLAIGAAAALVAVATFLFSPFTLSLPLIAATLGLMTAFAAVLLLLFWSVAVRYSVAGFVGLATLAGLLAGIPHLVPLVAVVCGTAVIVLLRHQPPLPRLVWICAALSFSAAAVPNIPDRAALEAMSKRYIHRHSPWVGLESILLGQRSHADINSIWDSAEAGPLDVPLGGLLAPLAIPRTPLRLWGDTLLEPVGAALGACGVAVCARRVRRDRGARMLLAMLGAAVVPGLFVSSYDRTSLVRLITVPVVLAFCAGVGFDALWRTLLPRARPTGVALCVVLISAASGIVLFDVINPRLLAVSSLGLTLRALRGGPPADQVVVLEPADPRYHFLNLRAVAAALPSRPLRVATYQRGQLLAVGEGAPALVVWSPGMEQEEQVGRSLCQQWPHAALYTLVDAAGGSRAYAASPAGPSWHPTLPERQWSVTACAPP